MLLFLLIITPLLGMVATIGSITFKTISIPQIKLVKKIGLITTIINLALSFLIFILFDYSINQFQFVQEYHQIGIFDIYLGIDGLSIYFVLLTTIISPIALVSN